MLMTTHEVMVDVTILAGVKLMINESPFRNRWTVVLSS